MDSCFHSFIWGVIIHLCLNSVQFIYRAVEVEEWLNYHSTLLHDAITYPWPICIGIQISRIKEVIIEIWCCGRHDYALLFLLEVIYVTQIYRDTFY